MMLIALAQRNLWRNVRRTRLVIGMVAVGILSMVTFYGVTTAINDVQESELVFGQTGALQIHRHGYAQHETSRGLEYVFTDTPELRQRIRDVPGVVAVAPRLDFYARLSVPRPGAVAGDPAPPTTDLSLRIIALEPESAAQVVPLPFKRVVRGKTFASGTGDELLLHRMIAKPLKLSFDPKGVAADAPAPALFTADADGVPRARLVTIVGEWDEPQIPSPKGLLTLTSAQKLLDLEGKITTYMVRIPPGVKPEDVQTRLVAILGADYEVRRWDEIAPIIKQLNALNDRIYWISMIVFLSVIGIAIVNSMMMTVLERIREIGTMAALGMASRQVGTLFLAEGFLAGSLGGAVGVALGAVFTLILGWLGFELPSLGSELRQVIHPVVSIPFLLGAWLTACIGCALAGLGPAWRAAKLNPVDALKDP